MIGFIKKDLLMIKGNLKSLAVILIIFGLITIEQNNNLLFFPIFISLMLSISTFSYDEYNKWNSYAITFPSGRKNLIKAKYLSALLLASLATILSIILLLSLGIMSHNFNIKEIFSEMLICFFSISVILSIMYPIIFKFGVEKGRIAIFIGIFILATILGLLIKKIKVSIPQNLLSFLNHNYLILLPVLVLLILLASYKISIYIYYKKEC